MPTHRTIALTLFSLCTLGTYLSATEHKDISTSSPIEEPSIPLPGAASGITKDDARLKSLAAWRKEHASTWKSLSMTEKTCIHAKYTDANSTLSSIENAINVCTQHERTSE